MGDGGVRECGRWGSEGVWEIGEEGRVGDGGVRECGRWGEEGRVGGEGRGRQGSRGYEIEGKFKGLDRWKERH